MENTELKQNMASALAGLADFESASAAVIEFLHAHIDVGMWMATRVSGEHQVLLAGSASCYGLEPGASLPWADTICQKMTMDEGPHIALDVSQVPTYAQSPLLEYAEVGGYVGVPIKTADGALFGTLCALNPKAQTIDISDQLPLLKLMAQLLGSIATLEIEAVRHSAKIESLQAVAFTDSLTGLVNRGGWNEHLKYVETTLAHLGSPLSIFIIDLDNLKAINDGDGHAAGDFLLKAAAAALSECMRAGDVVARVGGDEFAVAALECDAPGTEGLEQRMAAALAEQGISASIGTARHKPWNSLNDTIKSADKAMYRAKQAKQLKHVKDELYARSEQVVVG